MRLPAPRPAREKVAGGAAEPEHDACMLNRVVRKPQRSSNRPDIGPDGKSHHFGKPCFTYDLDIIVQEAQHLAGGRRGGAVVDRRPIEGTLVAQNPRQASLLDLLEIVLADRVGRAVVDDEDFQARI